MTRFGSRFRLRFAAATMALASGFALGSAALAAEPVKSPRGVADVPERTGRAVVLFDEGMPRTARIARGLGLRQAGRQAPKLDALIVEIPAGSTLGELRSRLQSHERVVAVEPEYRRQLRVAPNDPGFGAPDPKAPQGDSTQWFLRKSKFEAAWDISKGARATVGVVDVGADAGHPDLSGQIRALVDQDPTAFAAGAGTDTNGHGTHVAGLACADANNGFGIAGAGFDCGLIIEKSDLSDGSVAASIIDAVDRGAEVINLSLGGPGESSVIKRAVDYAIERDVVLVAAAVNEGSEDQGIPAEYIQPRGTAFDLNVNRGLVVTSADYGGARVPQAGFGTGVTLAAYGDSTPDTPGIISTWPRNSTEIDNGSLLPPSPPCFCRTSVGSDNRFAYLFGTSMAAPQVAGAAALIRSLNPKLSAAKTVRAIKEGTGASYNPATVGWGVLDATGAIARALQLESDPPESSARTTRTVRSRTFTVKLRASDPVVDLVPATGLDRVRVFYARSGSSGYRVHRTVKATGFSDGRHSFRFRGTPGHTYRFYSRAVDKAGNEEAVPSGADSRTTIKRRR